MKILGMGVPELLIILAVILLIFGPKNLPKLGASVGKTVKSLREGLGGGEKLVEADDEEEAVEEIVEEAAPAAAPKKTVKVAKKADKVLICFEEARELVGGGDKVELTGSPVRGEIVFADRAKARQKLGLSDSDRLVVSFWGSMGAKYMNEHMAGMLALETKQGSTFRHIHATGSAAFQWLPKMACEQGAKLTGGNIEVTEYIYDMASYMAAADLVICRAGAATIGELCALGKPSIMVPSPYVAENHQEKNARALEHAGV